jgi:glycosyltransferase involved in cell wall biosynthesis
MSKLRVAWFSPHPIHYNNFLFRNLSGKLPIDLRLFFFNKVLANYPWKSELSSGNKVYVFKKKLGVDWKIFWKFIYSESREFDAIVVAGWSEPTMMLLLSYFRVTTKSYILYTDTPNVNRQRNLKQWLRRIWLSWILSGSKAVLVTGIRGFKTLEEWGASRHVIYNFPFATDLNYFSPNVNFPSTFSDPIKIVASGRLDVRHKGYDTALRGLALLKQRKPEIKFTYTVAGTGPDEEQIRNLIFELGLSSEVNLLGWLETDTLLKKYRESDVLLHAAVNDPFPNAVLEAMACGLVVVGSDSSGSVLERIKDRVNGLIHQTNNAESVYECLSYLSLRNEEEIKSLKLKSFDTAQKWSVEYNIQVMSEILFKK